MSGLGSILEVTVASRDVDRQARFCRAVFQFETVVQDAGSLLLGAPGSDKGRLRLVSADVDPRLPAPEVFEPGPRLLGVYSSDVPRTHDLVAAAGGSPRPYKSFRTEGMGAYTEGSARGFDDIVWVYPCPERRLPSPAFDSDPVRLHGELHHVGLTVEDVPAATEFFAGAAGMTVVADQKIEADWACDLIGIPHGTRIHLACLAGGDAAPIRLVLASYIGPVAAAACSSARSVGIRRISFESDPPTMTDKLVRAGATQLGPGLVRGPAGVEIELRPRAQSK